MIISAVKGRARRLTHKYEVELPLDVKHAYELDANNKDDHWTRGIRKEMIDAGIAFEVLATQSKVWTSAASKFQPTL